MTAAALFDDEEQIQAAVDRAADAIASKGFFRSTARSIPKWRLHARVVTQDLLRPYLAQARAESVGSEADQHLRALILWWRQSLRTAADIYIASHTEESHDSSSALDGGMSGSMVLSGLMPDFKDAHDYIAGSVWAYASAVIRATPGNTTPNDVRRIILSSEGRSREWISDAIATMIIWDDIVRKRVTSLAETDVRGPTRSSTRKANRGERKRKGPPVARHVSPDIVAAALNDATIDFKHDLREIIRTRMAKRAAQAITETTVPLQWLPFGKRTVNALTSELFENSPTWQKARFRVQRLDVLHIVGRELQKASAIWGEPLDLEIAHGLPRSQLLLTSPDGAEQVDSDQYLVLRAKYPDGRVHSLTAVSPVTIQNGLYAWMPFLDDSEPIDPGNQVFSTTKTDAHLLYNARMYKWAHDDPPVVDEVHIAAARVLTLMDRDQTERALKFDIWDTDLVRSGWPGKRETADEALRLSRLYPVSAAPPLDIVSTSKSSL